MVYHITLYHQLPPIFFPHLPHILTELATSTSEAIAANKNSFFAVQFISMPTTSSKHAVNWVLAAVKVLKTIYINSSMQNFLLFEIHWAMPRSQFSIIIV